MTGTGIMWFLLTGFTISLDFEGIEAAITMTNPPLAGSDVLINEDVTVPSVIFTAAATSGLALDVFYTMTSTVSDEKFTLNVTTGEVSYINNPNFNFEKTPTYTLSITAMTGGTNENPVTRDLRVDIQDINEPPFITNLPKCLNVFENSERNRSIFDHIKAEDPEKRHLTYCWKVEPAAGKNFFEIKQMSHWTIGDFWVTNAAVLDYERYTNFNITTWVEDDGKIGSDPPSAEPPLTKTTLPAECNDGIGLKSKEWVIHVQILDVNENPTFKAAEVSNQKCEVTEEALPGTVVPTSIHQFRATDVDRYPGPDCLAGNQHEFVEYFLEGKYSELFGLKTTHVVVKIDGIPYVYQEAVLVVEKRIDREDPHNPKSEDFTLYVNARDSRGLRTPTPITLACKLLDIDDHPTQCHPLVYNATVQENTDLDVVVGEVSCSDEDDVAAHPITFEILDAGINPDAAIAEKYFYFPKNANSNKLTTKRRVDLEGGTSLKFEVLARQGAAFSQTSMTMTFGVTVSGTFNAHRPVPLKDFFNFQCPVDAKEGHVCGKVSAKDRDDPTSKETISYFLIDREESFMVGTFSGEVYVDYTNLDSKQLRLTSQTAPYWMSVQCKDGGHPTPLKSKPFYIRIDTYRKQDVMVKIVVAVEFPLLTKTKVKDFEQSISNICKPCMGHCPEVNAKGTAQTEFACFALKDDRTYYEINKDEPAEFVTQDTLIDYLTDSSLRSGDIYGFGTYDIVSVAPYDEEVDLLPLWIALGILGAIGLITCMAFAIKAGIQNGLCRRTKPNKEPVKDTKFHPTSEDVNTFQLNYLHTDGPM